jgi:hypothetical protein
VEVLARDEAFVRARRADVHAYLADVGGYGSWWPGASSRPHGDRTLLDLRAGLGRSHTMVMRVARVRPDLGLALEVRGAFTGEAEWYYLDERDGVRVNWLLRAWTPVRGARRRLTAHRAAIRRGLTALKDLAESGRVVGEEPQLHLLGDAFRAGGGRRSQDVHSRPPMRHCDAP